MRLFQLLFVNSTLNRPRFLGDTFTLSAVWPARLMAISHYRWHLLAVKSFSRGHCDCVRAGLIKLAFKSSREEITIRYKNWLLIYLSIWPFTWISIWISIWIFIWLFSLLTTDLMQFLWNFQVRSQKWCALCQWSSSASTVRRFIFGDQLLQCSFYSVCLADSANKNDLQCLPGRLYLQFGLQAACEVQMYLFQFFPESAFQWTLMVPKFWRSHQPNSARH